MPGWCGQALEFDLGTGQSSILPLSTQVLCQTLGGRGLAGHLLRTRSVDLYNPLVCFATGPFCGADIQTAERLVAVFRSPLTTGIFDCSSGCSFASALKRSGFDALLLKGEASVLSHLQIDNSGGCLQAVSALAGLETDQTLLRLDGLAALVIGPAGENRVRFASVVASAGEPLARGGLGAVLGQMNLKALSASGEIKFPVADEDACRVARADIQRLCHASPYLYGPHGIGVSGTAALLDLTQSRQMLPTNNFRHTTYPPSVNFSASILKKLPGFSGNPCPGCLIACRKKDATGDLPEYDSLAHFSALLGVNDLSMVLALERTCQALGLDPVSTAVVLSSCHLDSPRLQDQDTLLKLLTQIAHRSGEGADLADGLKFSVEMKKTPGPKFCVKGLELSAFDPRGAYGLALSMALSTSGEHRHALAYFHELLRKPVPTERFSFSGKARIIMQAEDAIAASDSLVVCQQLLVAAGLEEFAGLLTAVTGLPFDAASLVERGRQTILRERWLNQQYGFNADDDSLPNFFFDNDGSSSSSFPVPALDRRQFSAERDRYYRLRGLDENGQLTAPPREPE